MVLTAGDRGSAAYARGGLARDDLLPGVSDIDLALVVGAPERARRRWGGLARALPGLALAVDTPRVYHREELEELDRSSAFTCDRVAYLDDAGLSDRRRMLERPGLYGGTSAWRPLARRDSRPRPHSRDRQEVRIAAWLELLYWWRWVFPACADPTGPRTASLCVKLVSEPTRILLWLEHGERTGGREETLRRALARLPEEEPAFRRALGLNGALPSSPEPPLGEVLPVLVRLSERIAGRLAAEVAAEGVTEVRLTGEADAPVLPLADWRELVERGAPAESFAVRPGDPGDPDTLARAAQADAARHHPVLHSGNLMVMPG